MVAVDIQSILEDQRRPKAMRALKHLEDTSNASDLSCLVAQRVLKDIKNSVIGSVQNKNIYIELNAIDILQRFLSGKSGSLSLNHPVFSDIFIEISSILCSFARDNRPAALQMKDSGCASLLFYRFSAISHQITPHHVESQVTERKQMIAILKSLHVIFTSIPGDVLLDDPTMASLIHCLIQPHVFGHAIIEAASQLLVVILINTPRKKSQEKFCYPLLANIAPWIQYILMHASDHRLTHSLHLLSLLIYDDVGTTQQLIRQCPTLPSFLKDIVKDTASHVPLRLYAAMSLVYIHKMLEKSQTMSRNHKESTDVMKFTVIPALMKLLACEQPLLSQTACHVLSCLIDQDELLQSLACDLNTFDLCKTKLASLPPPSSTLSKSPLSLALQMAPFAADQQELLFHSPYASLQWIPFQASLWMLISSLCSRKEEGRRQMIELRLFHQMLTAFDDDNNDIVQWTALRTARHLTRSVRHLRTSLLDYGLANPLLSLIKREHEKQSALAGPHVLSMAIATLSNIVLEFSPMKKIVIDSGILSMLIAYATQGSSLPVRLNALWALKNLLFDAESAIRHSLLGLWSWRGIRDALQVNYEQPEGLLHDSLLLLEQSMNLVRNLACTRDAQWDVDGVLRGMHEETLFSLLDVHLEHCLVLKHCALCDHLMNDIVLQSIYLLVNICTASAPFKLSLMAHPRLLRHVMLALTATRSDIREAAVWVLINLTWPDSDASCHHQMIDALQEKYHVEDQLKTMVNDMDREVRHRVKTALDQIRKNVTGRSAGGLEQSSSGPLI